MDSTGLSIGVIPMDAAKVTAAFAHLNRIHNAFSSSELKSRVGAASQEVEGIGLCELVVA